MREGIKGGHPDDGRQASLGNCMLSIAGVLRAALQAVKDWFIVVPNLIGGVFTMLLLALRILYPAHAP